jgi:hypothetical protein
MLDVYDGNNQRCAETGVSFQLFLPGILSLLVVFATGYRVGEKRLLQRAGRKIPVGRFIDQSSRRLRLHVAPDLRTEWATAQACIGIFFQEILY